MLFDKVRDELKQAVIDLNVSGDHQKAIKNGECYGKVEVLSQLMAEMGHAVDGQVKNSSDGLRHIIYMTLDGEKIGELKHDVAD